MMDERLLKQLKAMRDDRRDIFALVTDSYDIRQFRGLLEQSTALVELQQIALEVGETGGPLIQDVFDGLFKPMPRMNKNIGEAYGINSDVLEELMRTTEYAHLHSATSLDEFGAALGTISLGGPLLKVFREYKQQQESAEEAKREAEAKQKEAEQRGDQAAAMDAGQRVSDAKGAQQANKDRMRRSLRKEAQKASEDVENGKTAVSMVSETWGTEQGQETIKTLGEKLTMAEALLKNSRFRMIARLLGRIRIISDRVQMSKAEYEVGEIVDITIGNDIGRLLPSEMMMLKNPRLKRAFMRKYFEHSLLEYNVKSLVPSGKGPVVVAIDESGSMMRFGGAKLYWAKAVFVALAKIAQQQKRALAVVRFASSADIAVKVWPHAQIKLTEVIDVANRAFNGGTSFERPFAEAIDILRTAEFMRGDLAFITDGECALSESRATEYVKIKQAIGFRAIGVLVGEGSFDTQTERVLDAVTHVHLRGPGQGSMTENESVAAQAEIDDLESLEQVLSI